MKLLKQLRKNFVVPLDKKERIVIAVLGSDWLAQFRAEFTDNVIDFSQRMIFNSKFSKANANNLMVAELDFCKKNLAKMGFTVRYHNPVMTVDTEVLRSEDFYEVTEKIIRGQVFKTLVPKFSLEQTEKAGIKEDL